MPLPPDHANESVPPSNGARARDEADAIAQGSTEGPGPGGSAELAFPPAGFLLVVSGAAHGRLFRLDSRVTVLGSASDADVLFADEGVAKHHAQLRRDPPNLVLEVLDGRSSTFVNGAPIERRALVAGDRVQLGEHARFKYLSRLGDGLEHQALPQMAWTPNGAPTRSEIHSRTSPED